VWNRRIPLGETIEPRSARLVAELAAEVNRELEAGNGPSFAMGRGSTTLYKVESGQRRVRIRLDTSEAPPMLRRALAAVPIPADAEPADGPDRRMTILQPSKDRLWELSGARHRADGWHASWGGAIRDVSTSRGYYHSGAWRGATPDWGATASGFPAIAGTILIDELRHGRINHALAVGLPAPREGQFAWPAQRTDGTGPLSALPEGAWLRLDPELDVGALRVPRLTRMLARAAQHHGLLVREQTPAGISLFVEDPAPLRRNPYRRQLSGKRASNVLASFPWDRLQVLDLYLCWSAPCRRD
jgi:hypothetical protein